MIDRGTFVCTMSSAEDFNYYDALGVEKTATFQEIRESFKGLALIHHPDKNPEDFENATARFQRINTAHAVLSDEALRADYDNQTVDPSQDYQSSSRASTFDGIFVFRFNGGGVFSLADILEALGGGRPYNPGGARVEIDEISRMVAAREATKEAVWRRIREKRRAREEQFREERRASEEAAEEIRQAELEIKKLDAERQKTSKEERDNEERRLQEERWKSKNATTEAEKRTACLHSYFWPKEQYRKKIQCEKCGRRRGMTAYRCPHCALLACQVCLNTFNAERNPR